MPNSGKRGRLTRKSESDRGQATGLRLNSWMVQLSRPASLSHLSCHCVRTDPWVPLPLKLHASTIVSRYCVPCTALVNRVQAALHLCMQAPLSSRLLPVLHCFISPAPGQFNHYCIALNSALSYAMSHADARVCIVMSCAL